MKQTLDMKRAADALKKVEEINQKHDADWKDKYASYVESLPATIINCGLGQAAATLLAAAKRGEKGESESDPHYVLYRHLEEWLCGAEPEAPFRGQDKLLKAITSHDRNNYIKAQAEALAWLDWLKKLAVAYLKKEKRSGDDVTL